ncbi:hypothetical protein TNCV_3644871 [Trichonephila clavipes]|nr:hypothetical protein TNCV_3644871 [Trichonephila clavipes]
MFDGLVAFAMDRWRHDCGAHHITSGSPMSEGRFDLSTFRSERTNEASTLTITPKRSSSRDVAKQSVLQAMTKRVLYKRRSGASATFIHAVSLTTRWRYSILTSAPFNQLPSVAHRVTKIDLNLVLSPRFRYVSIESPL